MAKDKVMAITNGTYTFTETDVKNEFYFYRNDGEVLGKIEDEPLEFYQVYIMQKMHIGEITDMVMSNINFAISTDGKCIRLTVSEIGTAEEKPKKLNFFQKIIKKIFG